MLVATPFFLNESYVDFRAYTRVLSQLGQCDGHGLVVVTQRQDEEAAIEFSKNAGKLFTDTSVEVVDAVHEGRLTGVANALFKAAIYFYRDYAGLPGQQGDVPLLYNDPTWHPHARGWLDAIQAEYFAKGCPQVLCRWKANDDGEKVTRGPVIFAKKYAADPPLVPHIPPHVHWRDYLRHEIGQLAVASETICTGKKSVMKPVRKSAKK